MLEISHINNINEMLLEIYHFEVDSTNILLTISHVPELCWEYINKLNR